mmetsp:Transcript_14334/g.47825  ORF Transcript_14334/g.47825 Transcript_14334/m.47825 type:complete len:322 (-) Transcript_14334:186-1151(-)
MRALLLLVGVLILLALFRIQDPAPATTIEPTPAAPNAAGAGWGRPCPAVHYPRSVKSVLTRNQTAYLSSLYFHGGLRWLQGRYFKLWGHINRTGDPAALGVIESVRTYVARNFGTDFVILNDFYSYKAINVTMFPLRHQDGNFWMTDSHGCRGFNLWVLLDHHGYNTAFSVLPLHANPDLYRGLDLFMNASAQRRIWSLRLKGLTKAGVLAEERTPLRIGDALVVRQPEIHATDKEKLKKLDGQWPWRLAIGFKLVTQGLIVDECAKSTLRTDPMYRAIGADPLLPSWKKGAQLESPFDYLEQYRRARGEAAPAAGPQMSE